MSERNEQIAYFQWVRIKAKQDRRYEMIVGFPMQGFGSREIAIRAASARKQEGMPKGFPDIGIFIPRGDWHGAFVEFKKNGGRPTPEQKDWIKNLEAQGYRAAVVHGLDDLIDFTSGYLGAQ